MMLHIIFNKRFSWMQKYYTADSANGLFESGVSEFCIVGLGDYTPKQPEQADFLNQMYPEGLSKHGYNYLYNPNIMMGNLTHASKALMIGLVFELVRRSHFPEKPSRYQSLFACQQVSEAKQFRELLADEKENDQIRKASIYEVITQRTVHRGDMELVKSDCPVLDLYRRAHLYWSGETVPYKDGGEPFCEILIPLPVLIGQRVPE
ncbi:DUF2441 domain-containing protein [Arsenophonus sp. PmNCSU2021_1]|uniref:DUF2441 domain-containing protein n=1 Tax=Arsenophonus sp. PmNCSU2021_1 TaxID=3118989 RepID=UPI002FEE9224